MPNKSRPTFRKRQRELEMQQRRQEKQARRLARKERAAQRPRVEGGEDPDIAGIRPGPQPPTEDPYVPPIPDRPKRPPQDE